MCLEVVVPSWLVVPANLAVVVKRVGPLFKSLAHEVIAIHGLESSFVPGIATESGEDSFLFQLILKKWHPPTPVIKFDRTLDKIKSNYLRGKISQRRFNS